MVLCVIGSLTAWCFVNVHACVLYKRISKIQDSSILVFNGTGIFDLNICLSAQYPFQVLLILVCNSSSILSVNHMIWPRYVNSLTFPTSVLLIYNAIESLLVIYLVFSALNCKHAFQLAFNNLDTIFCKSFLLSLIRMISSANFKLLSRTLSIFKP